MHKVLLVLSLLFSSLMAADLLDDAGCYVMGGFRPVKRCPTRLDPNPFDHPYHGWGNWVRTNKAKFESPQNPRERFRFSQWDMLVGFVNEVNCLTGFAFQGAYRWTHFHWDSSPFLRHKRFNEAGVFVRGFTHALPGWHWRYGIGWWQQLAVLNMGRYGLFDGLLWGRYDLCPNLGVHIGVVTQPGKRKGFTRPIAGVDFRFRRRIKVNLIYPIDMSVLYEYNDFCFGVAGRPQRSRMRMRANDPVSQGLIEYRSWGVELKGVYEPNGGVNIEAYVGSTVWTFVRVQTTLARPIAYRNLESTLYYGVYAFFAY